MIETLDSLNRRWQAGSVGHGILRFIFLIKKTVSFSSRWPIENGQQLLLKLKSTFPNADIIEREYQERDFIFMMPTLSILSPYLELPVHCEYEGTQVSYILFGLNENQLAAHPKKDQIADWLHEQILKLQNISAN